jgi:hypothetical protein
MVDPCVTWQACKGNEYANMCRSVRLSSVLKPMFLDECTHCVVVANLSVLSSPALE